VTAPVPPTTPPSTSIPQLRREVEPPRPPVGPWMPISLLGTATMLTIATAIGVMTRMPHDVPTTPALDDTRIVNALSPPSAAPATPTKSWVPRKIKQDPRFADVKKAVEERGPALEACMREWAKRSSQSAAGVNVAFFLQPSGAIEHVSTGPGNRVEPACIAKPLRTMRLPSGSEEAFVLIGLRYVGGEFDALTNVTPVSAFGPP